MSESDDYLTISCPAGHRLKINKRLAGRTIQCPGKKDSPCGISVVVPAEPQREAQAATLRPTVPEAPGVEFECENCYKKVKVAASLAGKTIPCPHCKSQVDVPKTNNDEETYGLARDEEKADSLEDLLKASEDRPTLTDWCADDYENQPRSVVTDLEAARRAAKKRDWEFALEGLHDAFRTLEGKKLRFQSNFSPKSRVLWKPLAYCYVHKMIEEMLIFRKKIVRFSPAFEQFLRKIQTLRKLGAKVPSHECTLCELRHETPIGTALRTPVGRAYICGMLGTSCRPPTKADGLLFEMVHLIHEQLVFAQRFSPNSADVALAMKTLPWWFGLIEPHTNDGVFYWFRPVNQD